MSIRRTLCLFGSAAALAAIPLMSATAQSPSSPPSTPPPASTQAAPGPAEKQAPSVSERPATSPAKVTSLVGLQVTSSDGTKMGTVQSVGTQDGKVTAIHIKSGGFLGMGGKLVAIPQGKFSKTGDSVTLSMTADEVSKLPELKISG
jgi:sporulation protein YlmC with PRC-barrel domain